MHPYFEYTHSQPRANPMIGHVPATGPRPRTRPPLQSPRICHALRQQQSLFIDSDTVLQCGDTRLSNGSSSENYKILVHVSSLVFIPRLFVRASAAAQAFEVLGILEEFREFLCFCVFSVRRFGKREQKINPHHGVYFPEPFSEFSAFFGPFSGFGNLAARSKGSAFQNFGLHSRRVLESVEPSDLSCSPRNKCSKDVYQNCVRSVTHQCSERSST